MVMMGRYVANACVKRGESIKFGTFDFLGFSFYCGRSRKGKPWILPKTAGKKFRKKLKAMKVWLYRHRTLPLKQIMDMVNKKLVGHYRYHGIVLTAIIQRISIMRRSQSFNLNYSPHSGVSG